MARQPAIRYQTATPAVQAELVQQYHRFLWSVVKWAIRRNRAWLNFTEDDLYQEAVLFLFDAWERFDPSRQLKFLTYATTRVRYKLVALTETAGLIRVPSRGLDRSEAVRASAERAQAVVSLSRECAGHDLPDVAAPETPAPPHEVEVEAAVEAVRRLPERQRWLMELRYGLWDGRARTLREAGQVLGVTHERVRQIEAEALADVRDAAGKMVERRAPESECLRRQGA